MGGFRAVNCAASNYLCSARTESMRWTNIVVHTTGFQSPLASGQLPVREEVVRHIRNIFLILAVTQSWRLLYINAMTLVTAVIIMVISQRIIFMRSATASFINNNNNCFLVVRLEWSRCGRPRLDLSCFLIPVRLEWSRCGRPRLVSTDPICNSQWHHNCPGQPNCQQYRQQ